MKTETLKSLVKTVLQEVERNKWASSDNDTMRYAERLLEPLINGKNSKDFVRWTIFDVGSVTEMNLDFKMLKSNETTMVFTLARKINAELVILAENNFVKVRLRFNKNNLRNGV